MQFINRKSVLPPRALNSESVKLHTQEIVNFFSADAIKMQQSRVPTSDFSLEHFSIRDGLNRLFRNKCAFCESQSKTTPYRFRPVSNARPSERNSWDHLYYTWLSYSWENIYPICSECHPIRPDYFPVQGKRAPLPSERELVLYQKDGSGLWQKHPPKERPLLLDPCSIKSFVNHFSVDHEGNLFGHTQEAATTIEYFNLDRAELVERRRIVLSGYLERYSDLSENIDDIKIDHWKTLFNFSEMEFGGLWYLMCRKIYLSHKNTPKPKAALSQNSIGNTLYKTILNENPMTTGADLVKQMDTWKYVPVVDRPKLPKIRFGNLPTLTSFKILNFKGIEKLELKIAQSAKTDNTLSKDIQPALLILGENAAGKSSVLEAITLALASEEARDELSLNYSELLLDPKLLGAEHDMQTERAEIKLFFSDETSHTLTISNNSCKSPEAYRIPPVFAYGAFRQYQKTSRRKKNSSSISNLFYSDKLLSNPESWLLKLNQNQFNRVVRILREILSIEGEFEVLERDLETRQCLIRIKNDNNSVTRTPLKLASSGYRSMLAMVCDIIQGLMAISRSQNDKTLDEAQAIVLIDEIEAHLHPRWKIQVMTALRVAFPKVTFIVTTHDPLCLRGMHDGEVVVMHRVANQQDTDRKWPILTEQLVNLPKVSDMTVEQLLTSDFFSLMSTEEPSTEREIAQISHLLASRRAGNSLSETEQNICRKFEDDIRTALPIGNSEAHMLVQEAVADFLYQRREASAKGLAELRRTTKDRIIKILEGV